MGFATRWDYIFDKAKKSKSEEQQEELLDSWATCVSNAHKKFRAFLGPEETERFAEEQWWKFLFPDEQFPTHPDDWLKNDPRSILGATSTIPELTGMSPHNTGIAITTNERAQIPPKRTIYKSCFALIVNKANKEGINPELVLKYYAKYIRRAERDYLGKGSQIVVQFKAELYLWRVLFPSEIFPGLDPYTGKPNPRTLNEIKEEQRRAYAQLDNDLARRLDGIALDREEGNQNRAGGEKRGSSSPSRRAGQDRGRTREGKEYNRANSRSASPGKEKPSKYRERDINWKPQSREDYGEEKAGVKQDVQPEDAVNAACDGSDDGDQRAFV